MNFTIRSETERQEIARAKVEMSGPGVSGATHHFPESRTLALPANLIRNGDDLTLL